MYHSCQIRNLRFYICHVVLKSYIQVWFKNKYLEILKKYILRTSIRVKLVVIVMRWCWRYTAVVPNICLTIFKMFVCLLKQLKDVSKEALTTFAEMISLNYISLKVGVLQRTHGTSFLRFGFAFLSFAWMRKYIVKLSLQGILMWKKVASFATPGNWFMKKWKWLSICGLNCSKMVETLFFLIFNVMLSVKASVLQAVDEISQHCVLESKSWIWILL